MFKSRTKRDAAAFEMAERRARISGGDVGDGGLMIITASGETCLYAPADVTHPMRYAVSRIQSTSGKGDVPSSFAVTSSLSGEGVSFVAATLAAVVSNDLARSVCLVDLNWWGPEAAAKGSAAAPNDQRTDQPPGAAQVVSGRSVLDAVLVPTVNPQLWLLPCGPASRAERPVLARSAALVTMVEELKSRFDHVVLDLPPVLAVGESLTMVGLAEGYVLVVQEGVTSDHDVAATLQDLDRVSMLGVILNRSVSRVPKRILRLFAA